PVCATRAVGDTQNTCCVCGGKEREKEKREMKVGGEKRRKGKKEKRGGRGKEGEEERTGAPCRRGKGFLIQSGVVGMKYH
ncbi:hypothetical protein, partial [Escherichia coli]|uniref:hypothetical protein n=1 Tax=Escherichia coli TaxID=562 RepID=UPI001BB475A3